MSFTESEAIQLYFSRIRPIYHQLYNIAHFITGSCEQAESALQFAMMDFWMDCGGTGSRHGFREGLRGCVKRAALKSALSGEAHEFDLEPIDPEAPAAEKDPLYALLAAEAPQTQRLIILRLGCGMTLRRAARLVDLEPPRAQTAIRRFEARARRRRGADRAKGEIQLTALARDILSTPSATAPEIGNIFRTFEADAANVTQPNRLPSRIAHAALAVLLALLCMFVFWLTAVLMQPAVLEETAPVQEAVADSTLAPVG